MLENVFSTHLIGGRAFDVKNLVHLLNVQAYSTLEKLVLLDVYKVGVVLCLIINLIVYTYT